jgi:hypothetical protein
MRENENVIIEIDSFRAVPLRLNDLVTVPAFMIIGITILFLLKPDTSSVETYQQLYYIFILPLVLLMTLFLTLGRIFRRWYDVKLWKYIVTNQRILFLDKQFNNVVKAFELDKIEIDYTENASNNGYITIEVSNTKIDVNAIEVVGFFFTSHGIPFFENSNIIYNISSVRLVFKKIIEIQKEHRQALDR